MKDSTGREIEVGMWVTGGNRWISMYKRIGRVNSLFNRNVVVDTLDESNLFYDGIDLLVLDTVPEKFLHKWMLKAMKR